MNDKDFKESRFDAFLYKTIKMSSKDYFRTQKEIENNEEAIFDDENFSVFLDKFISDNIDIPSSTLEDIIELNKAINTLSAIEQAVIFLLFNKQISQEKAGEILSIWTQSVSRIKLRAIEKLRNYMKGSKEDEK